jgi:tRNA pseudouridine55 synthase
MSPVGVAVVDKSAGLTSHDVVSRARKLLDTRKIGHSGTLDPDATGLLILGVGSATRLLRFLTALPKRYVADVVLGVETTTLDAAGEVSATHDMAAVSLTDVAAAATSFVGEIQQVPPMVSAVKVDGRRLHELAREGKEIERESRTVVIHELTIGPAADPVASFSMDVACSSGTYIRSLAADIGTALGGGAHVATLRRTEIGSFTEADARPLEQLELLAPAAALSDYPAVSVDEEVARSIGYGQHVDAELFEGDGPWRVIGPDGSLLAMFERSDGVPRSAVVLACGDPPTRL